MMCTHSQGKILWNATTVCVYTDLRGQQVDQPRVVAVSGKVQRCPTLMVPEAQVLGHLHHKHFHHAAEGSTPPMPHLATQH